jgi:peptide/nickel transport system ATP-binding protein
MCATISRVMYAGQIVEFGDRYEVLERPAHPYTRALLGSFLGLMRENGKPVGLPGSPPDLANMPVGCRFCDRCCNAGDACSTETPQWIEMSPTHRVMCCSEGIAAGEA